WLGSERGGHNRLSVAGCGQGEGETNRKKKCFHETIRGWGWRELSAIALRAAELADLLRDRIQTLLDVFHIVARLFNQVVIRLQRLMHLGPGGKISGRGPKCRKAAEQKRGENAGDEFPGRVGHESSFQKRQACRKVSRVSFRLSDGSGGWVYFPASAG